MNLEKDESHKWFNMSTFRCIFLNMDEDGVYKFVNYIVNYGNILVHITFSIRCVLLNGKQSTCLYVLRTHVKYVNYTHILYIKFN